MVVLSVRMPMEQHKTVITAFPAELIKYAKMVHVIVNMSLVMDLALLLIIIVAGEMPAKPVGYVVVAAFVLNQDNK